MRANSYIIASFIVLTFCVYVSSDIGQNFEKAGIVLDGDGYFSFMPNDDGTSSINASIASRAGFLLIDNLSIDIRLRYFFSRSTYVDWPKRISHTPGVSAGVTYFFVPHPDVEHGRVHSLSFLLGASYSFSKAYGNSFDINLNPSYTFYYFLAERVAPFISFSPYIYLGDLDKSDKWGFTDLILRIGFSYFVRNRDKVLIRI